MIEQTLYLPLQLSCYKDGILFWEDLYTSQHLEEYWLGLHLMLLHLAVCLASKYQSYLKVKMKVKFHHSSCMIWKDTSIFNVLKFSAISTCQLVCQTWRVLWQLLKTTNTINLCSIPTTSRTYFFPILSIFFEVNVSSMINEKVYRTSYNNSQFDWLPHMKIPDLYMNHKPSNVEVPTYNQIQKHGKPLQQYYHLWASQPSMLRMC